MKLEAQLQSLRDAASRCRNCPLWKDATQTVFGAGPATAQIMLVGEQPGDREDLAGVPFVGPAGQLIDRALQDIGIDRATLYLTNAVKHFKYKLSGKRRLHKTPAQREIDACHGWLDAEIALIQPRLIVALGATAARALLQKSVPILANRGRYLRTATGVPVLLTVHPSSLLRTPSEERAAAYELFIRDLQHIKSPPPA